MKTFKIITSNEKGETREEEVIAKTKTQAVKRLKAAKVNVLKFVDFGIFTNQNTLDKYANQTLYDRYKYNNR